MRDRVTQAVYAFMEDHPTVVSLVFVVFLYVVLALVALVFETYEKRTDPRRTRSRVPFANTLVCPRDREEGGQARPGRGGEDELRKIESLADAYVVC